MKFIKTKMLSGAPFAFLPDGSIIITQATQEQNRASHTNLTMQGHTWNVEMPFDIMIANIEAQTENWVGQ